MFPSKLSQPAIDTVQIFPPDDDRTWKIQIMRAEEDGTKKSSPTGRVIELESD
jgi:hypothetical protein